ncbi:MAG: hypothetical protein ACPLW7_05695 [Minisyncoccia bacterium]|jgi:hypothetical protein
MNNNKDTKKIVASIDKDVFEYIFLNQININKSVRSCIYKLAYNIALNKNDNLSIKIKEKIENLIKTKRIYNYNVSLSKNDEQLLNNNSSQNETQDTQPQPKPLFETKPHTENNIPTTQEIQNDTQNLEQAKTNELHQKENQNTNQSSTDPDTKKSLTNF